MFNGIEKYTTQLIEQGYTVIPEIMTPQQVMSARSALDEIFQRERVLGVERGWHTEAHRVAYMLIQKHPFFRDVPMNPRLLEFVRALLGKDCILATLNGMTMSQGGKPQPLHLDQEMHVPGVVLNINCLHTLDDFTKANGCTRVVPRSQNRAPGTPIAPDDEQNAVYIEAPAGSLIAFNGGAVHAGSANTTDQPRRCLHAYFCRAWVRPHWDFRRSLTADVVAQLSEEQKRLFGFYAGPPWYDAANDRVMPY
jgi:ectoine hydroxylase-related dioxygenase (phytanoyl-CoA dioxygenase family)